MIVAARVQRDEVRLQPRGIHRHEDVGGVAGVVIEWSAIWTWKLETPARVPAGARISAGKSGSVSRSLPNAADTG